MPMNEPSFTNQGEVVECTIVTHITEHSKSGRRNSPAIPAGTLIYCIKYLHPLKGYFTYSYLDKAKAEAFLEKYKAGDTNTEFYMYWNRVESPEHTLHVA